MFRVMGTSPWAVYAGFCGSKSSFSFSFARPCHRHPFGERKRTKRKGRQEPSPFSSRNALPSPYGPLAHRPQMCRTVPAGLPSIRHLNFQWCQIVPNTIKYPFHVRTAYWITSRGWREWRQIEWCTCQGRKYKRLKTCKSWVKNQAQVPPW